MSKIVSFFRAHKTLFMFVIALFAIGGIIWARSGSSSTNELQIIRVTKGTILDEVSVTGKTKPSTELNLGFERSGRVVHVAAQIGDHVNAGQLIVTLENADLSAQVRQAEAGVFAAQAQLNKYASALDAEKIKLINLETGNRQEDVAITETKVKNAETSLLNTQENLALVQDKAALDLANAYMSTDTILNDAYLKADDAVRKQTDQLFSNDEIDPKLTFIPTNSQLGIEVESKRFQVTAELKSWKTELDGLNSSSSGDLFDPALNNATSHLSKIQDFLAVLSEAVKEPQGLSLDTTATYKAAVNTARTNVNTAKTNISNQQQSISTQKLANKNAITAAQTKVSDAESALSSAKNELTLKISGPTQGDLNLQKNLIQQAEANIAYQKTQIMQAQASVQNYRAQLGKSIIVSPISGIVTKQDAKVGQIVSPNSGVVTVVSDSPLEIEVNVPEVDISRLAIGNIVRITLDALTGETFEGKVVTIDPAETIVDGVVNYKVTVMFEGKDERLRSGFTANLRIETRKKEDVLLLPQYAIIENDVGKFIKKMTPQGEVELPVTLGIRSQEGMVEVIEGLQEGDEVLNIGFKKQS